MLTPEMAPAVKEAKIKRLEFLINSFKVDTRGAS